MRDLANQPTFRAALITMPGNRHRLVLTIHPSSSTAGRCRSCCGIFTSYYRQRACPGRVPQLRVLAGRPGPQCRPGDLARVFGASKPRPGGAAGRRGAVMSHRSGVETITTRAVGELSRSQRTTITTVLQAAWAQLLTSLTGQRDVAFGTAVSGRSVDLAGADSLVGLLINTVPGPGEHDRPPRSPICWASCSASTTTPSSTTTSPSASIALTGHDQLFDTLLVCENYPIDPSAFMNVADLAVTDFTSREYNHYRAVGGSHPGRVLGLRSNSTPMFDSVTVDRWSPVSPVFSGDGRRP